MEFADRTTKSSEKCMICLNPAWIKIGFIKNKERLNEFICVSHYMEFLEQFLSGTLSDSIILFDQKSKMLEIPLYEAMERFGGLNERELLEKYVQYLNNKIENIDNELTDATDHFFKNLLLNEKQDKYLRKLLALARIKVFFF